MNYKKTYLFLLPSIRSIVITNYCLAIRLLVIINDSYLLLEGVLVKINFTLLWIFIFLIGQQSNMIRPLLFLCNYWFHNLLLLFYYIIIFLHINTVYALDAYNSMGRNLLVKLLDLFSLAFIFAAIDALAFLPLGFILARRF